MVISFREGSPRSVTVPARPTGPSRAAAPPTWRPRRCRPGTTPPGPPTSRAPLAHRTEPPTMTTSASRTASIDEWRAPGDRFRDVRAAVFAAGRWAAIAGKPAQRRWVEVIRAVDHARAHLEGELLRQHPRRD